MTTLRELEERRAHALRLRPERALRSVDQAAGFLGERGLLTWAPDSTLPSLYDALHEDPARPERRWWFDDLAAHDDVYVLAIHRGKPVLLSEETAAIVDPVLCAEIERMGSGEDRQWRQLLGYLEQHGPSSFEDARRELGLKRHEFDHVVSPLERCGAISRRVVVLEAAGGEEEVVELARWDQVFDRPSRAGGIEDVVVAGVRAAVVTPERAIGRWFSWSWRLRPGLIDGLVAEGRLYRPEPGWVALPD